MPTQTLDIPQAAAAFIAAQEIKWTDSSKLAGTTGGDGDWAKESLAFDFHVETLEPLLACHQMSERTKLRTPLNCSLERV